MTESKIILPPDASLGAIGETIDSFGIVIMPAAIPDDSVTDLLNEFDPLLSPDDAFGRVHFSSPAAITASIDRTKLPPEKFPATYETFSSDWMREVTSNFYRNRPHSFNQDIFVNKNFATDEPVDSLPFIPHFDKMQTLKFFVYLTETSAANGAFAIEAASHKANREIREEALRKTGKTTKIDNVRASAATVPVEGPAGTIIIFDTDLTHRAGHVHPGKIRKIMRGHCRALN